jgi:hypothetical protein
MVLNLLIGLSCLLVSSVIQGIFVCFPIYKHVGCFQFGAIVNKVIILVQTFCVPFCW